MRSFALFLIIALTATTAEAGPLFRFRARRSSNAASAAAPAAKASVPKSSSCYVDPLTGRMVCPLQRKGK